MKTPDTCRDRLIAAGRAEFHRLGYDGASIRTITAMSEVRKRLPSRPAFYDRVKECLIGREGIPTAEELLFGLA